MAFGSDVKAAHVTASGSVYGGAARVKGIYYATNGAAGTLTFLDGGVAGTSKIVIDVPTATATAPFAQMIIFPDDGVRFTSNIYLTIAAAVVLGVTVFYG